jgi:hypothetical protein
VLVQAELERRVLPRGHKRRTDATLSAAVADIRAQPTAHAARLALQQTLDYLLQEDSVAVAAAISTATKERVHCDHIAHVCVAAFAVDTAAEGLSSESTDAPAWYRAVCDAALKWLQAHLQGAPEDTLQDVAEVRSAACLQFHSSCEPLLQSADLSAASCLAQGGHRQDSWTAALLIERFCSFNCYTQL